MKKSGLLRDQCSKNVKKTLTMTKILSRLCPFDSFFYVFNRICSLQKKKRLSGESSLVGQGVVNRIGSFPVQMPLGARPGLRTQPCYEAPGDLCVKYATTQ